jgi:hypothetical protein
VALLTRELRPGGRGASETLSVRQGCAVMTDPLGAAVRDAVFLSYRYDDLGWRRKFMVTPGDGVDLGRLPHLPGASWLSAEARRHAIRP